MKVFISLPMNDRTDEEIKNEIKRITDDMTEDVEIIDTLLDLEAPKNTGIHYLAKSIELLADADLVYMAKGWNSARGCKIEHEIAIQYGKKVIYEN